MNRPRLLFIDDEEINRSNFLETFGDEYEILLAGSGEEALEIMAREGTLALILSDQRMPGISGAEVLAQARELAPKAERIMITGYSEPEDMMAAINQGQVYRYILKPWTSGELRIAIIQAVERHQLKEENLVLLLALEKKNVELEELVRARTLELKNLQGLLPICSYCRKIRDDKNAWHGLEDYLHQHSDILFTHGICPHCYDKVVAENMLLLGELKSKGE
ncbi:response regulator [Thiovibrio frasassiensis]|uniref:Response regulator n=1 Tax=Thiovibrio frasassiensis TaxID=2984131 RepID=A0A9X4MI51_9BACT|nr:response regulator [Thiovibrio frasassiensis]MDG4476771.1 response regulator [Thiovibrio frasassiensis]